MQKKPLNAETKKVVRHRSPPRMASDLTTPIR
jgi:hypothetical protein